MPIRYIIISLDRFTKEAVRTSITLNINVFVMDRQIEFFTYFSYLSTYVLRDCVLKGDHGHCKTIWSEAMIKFYIIRYKQWQ